MQDNNIDEIAFDDTAMGNLSNGFINGDTNTNEDTVEIIYAMTQEHKTP